MRENIYFFQIQGLKKERIREKTGKELSDCLYLEVGRNKNYLKSRNTNLPFWMCPCNF
jgi:hypothetical protein